MLNCKIILNPASGGGRAAALVGFLKKRFHLKNEGIFVSENLSRAREEARKSAIIGINPVIAVGGDGILNAVLNGVLEVSNKIKLGYIPAGMSNVAANSIGIPQDFRKAAEVIKKGATKKIDLGKVVSGKNEIFYLSMADFGVTAEIIKTAERNGKIKSRFGKKIHPPVGFYFFASRKKFFDCRCHGRTYKCFQMIFSNGKFWGGDFFWSDNISIEDGRGDAFLFENMDFFRLLRIFHRLKRKQKIGGIRKLKAKSIEVFSSSGVPCQVDGEYIGKFKKARVEILPRAVQFYA
ncbi:MAG: hypothetical protein J7L54_03820 [Elusimicrobia bacterium]|nr:hypothetical protein [Elusimicrobiota bacterium]